MSVFTDQIGRVISLSNPPRRIISLVPSITELLFDLGLENEVVGITKFCIQPEIWFRTKTRVGGTKNVHMDLVASLHPDIIIANKEENVKEQIEQLEKIAPVWTSDITTFEDAMQMIKSIGEITNTREKALSLILHIVKNFSQLETGNRHLATAYLIWRNPYMTIGGDTFINDMLNKCGLQNVFENLNRYPEITIEQLVAANPQLILLSSEPYPFKEKHIEELKPFFSNSKITLVDGEMFSWYGSRMIYTPDYFSSLITTIEQ